MKIVALVFPNQLFRITPIQDLKCELYVVEEFLFFNHYKFHKQKIAFHRATMKSYSDYLTSLGFKVTYINATSERSDVRKLIPNLIKNGLEELHIIEPNDNWLEKHIKNASSDISITWYNNPLFINSKNELNTFFNSSKKKFFQTSFYKLQRTKRNILMSNGEPVGGKLTFDSENRKKYPKNKKPPIISFPKKTPYHNEAEEYVRKHFSSNYGHMSHSVVYPIDFETSETWLDQFLKTRFEEFGDYEDAIVQKEVFLNHSILSPLINVGLLNPIEVIKKTLEFADINNIPINSTEGFVRQIIGWREFIRGVYNVKGSEERTKNFWGFSRKIPASFYTGTTGIDPIDDVINKVLDTGYAHHIERLMVLGNFMVLCEFDPNDVYQWFMELFIDSYDWVMVPNVYGMSLYADGGLMSTKPYISSSNYIMKMSNYPKGNWQAVWDGLFWMFMDKHRNFFLKNPRLGMLIRTFDKMDQNKKELHFKNAEKFIKQLDE